MADLHVAGEHGRRAGAAHRKPLGHGGIIEPDADHERQCLDGLRRDRRSRRPGLPAGDRRQDGLDLSGEDPAGQVFEGGLDPLPDLDIAGIDLRQAVGSLKQALKQRPDWPEAKANLALLQDALTKQDDAEEEGSEPTEPPDQVQFDERGKKGKSGKVDAAQQTAEMWMRNIQTTPAQLLARRFAIEARDETRREQAP